MMSPSVAVRAPDRPGPGVDAAVQPPRALPPPHPPPARHRPAGIPERDQVHLDMDLGTFQGMFIVYVEYTTLDSVQDSYTWLKSMAGNVSRFLVRRSVKSSPEGSDSSLESGLKVSRSSLISGSLQEMDPTFRDLITDQTSCSTNDLTHFNSGRLRRASPRAAGRGTSEAAEAAATGSSLRRPRFRQGHRYTDDNLEWFYKG